jgi:hypothetical protein
VDVDAGVPEALELLIAPAEAVVEVVEGEGKPELADLDGSAALVLELYVPNDLGERASDLVVPPRDDEVVDEREVVLEEDGVGIVVLVLAVGGGPCAGVAADDPGPFGVGADSKENRARRVVVAGLFAEVDRRKDELKVLALPKLTGGRTN